LNVALNSASKLTQAWTRGGKVYKTADQRTLSTTAITVKRCGAPVVRAHGVKFATQKNTLNGSQPDKNVNYGKTKTD
jgi:hypothetical protein